ncbi:hypothetical protein ACLBYG_22140 [Methylobacterium sp. D53M]
MMAAVDPGRAAYEARFAHARPRDVEPWDSLTPEVRAIWAHVEAKSRGQVVAPDDVREALTEAVQRGLSGDHWWIVAEPREIADELIAGPLANLIASAAESDRLGSEYAGAMDARTADAVEMERLRKENDHLRASLANSDGPCPYCNLPKEEWSRCASGFPGCARGDDAMLCPHVGGELEVEARFARLLIAFHDATRRPLGITPDSGLEFYDPRMADEAEARRTGRVALARHTPLAEDGCRESSDPF